MNVSTETSPLDPLRNLLQAQNGILLTADLAILAENGEVECVSRGVLWRWGAERPHAAVLFGLSVWAGMQGLRLERSAGSTYKYRLVLKWGCGSAGWWRNAVRM